MEAPKQRRSSESVRGTINRACFIPQKCSTLWEHADGPIFAIICPVVLGCVAIWLATFSPTRLPPKPVQPTTRFPTPSSTAALANGHFPPTTDPSAAPSTRASRRQSPAEPTMPSAPSADGAASRRSARKVRVVPNYAPVATVDGRPLPTPNDRGPTDPSSWAEYPISDDRNDSRDTGGISTRYGVGAEGALNRRNNFKGRTGDKDVEAGPDTHPDGPQVRLISIIGAHWCFISAFARHPLRDADTNLSFPHRHQMVLRILTLAPRAYNLHSPTHPCRLCSYQRRIKAAAPCSIVMDVRAASTCYV